MNTRNVYSELAKPCTRVSAVCDNMGENGRGVSIQVTETQNRHATLSPPIKGPTSLPVLTLAVLVDRDLRGS